MRILNLATTPPDEVLATTVAVLQAGGLVIFPTETTYGAGVMATNPQAVAKLLQYKSRREGKPLSIALTDQAMAERFVELNDSARNVYQQFLPGPVTVVSKDRGQLAPGVASEFGTVGVRIPAYPLVIELVSALGQPITATSANASDAKRPYQLDDLWPGLSKAQTALIDLVLDAGQLPPNPPSTVIDTTQSTPLVFRQGALTIETSQTWESQSEQDTKALAGKLMLKFWNQVRTTGLVIGLDGSLGAGKTIFAKGVAEFLGITEIITSPTYTYLEEYPFTRHQTTGQLNHLDLWRVDSEDVYHQLQIPTLFKPNNVVVIEWFDQVKQWLEPDLVAAGTPCLKVVISETATGRQLAIQEPSS